MIGRTGGNNRTNMHQRIGIYGTVQCIHMPFKHLKTVTSNNIANIIIAHSYCISAMRREKLSTKAYSLVKIESELKDNKRKKFLFSSLNMLLNYMHL